MLTSTFFTCNITAVIIRIVTIMVITSSMLIVFCVIIAVDMLDVISGSCVLV